MLVEGEWQDVWYDTKSSQGAFVRPSTTFRQRIEPAAAKGKGRPRFPAERGRYHLYAARACPWAHRALLVRALKGLEETLPISIVNPLMLEHGWTFENGPGVVPDPIFSAKYLYEIYQKADPHYTGRVTVPVLWDKQEGTIVNNESSEVLRMLDSAFDAFATRSLPSLYPAHLRSEIDALNERIYETVNDGVYKAGFATAQDKYVEAVSRLFETLDFLEARLEGHRFLVGDVLTEADLRLFTTLLRFDAVYYGHFKCNVRRIVDYPNLRALLRRIHAMPHVAETVDFDHIKRHYYGSHRTINPNGIVPVGPAVIV